MSEPPPDYRSVERQRCRTAVAGRIAGRIADDCLADLPDVFLVIIDRALDRDMRGVNDFSRHPGYLFTPSTHQSPTHD